MIDEELEAARKRLGERQFVEDDIRENDMDQLLAKRTGRAEAKGRMGGVRVQPAGQFYFRRRC